MGAIDSRRIILGTASWGNLYGVNNSEEASSIAVRQMISKAAKNSIQSLDTAPSYGQSESLIGQYKNAETELYSKIAANVFGDGLRTARQAISRSIRNLNTTSLTGIAFHDASTVFDNPKESCALVDELREKQSLTRVGVSVYDVEQIYRILEFFKPDYIQAPVSLVDRRFVDEDVTRLLKTVGVELHARSIYLQGFLLQGTKGIQPYFSRWKWLMEEYETESENLGLTIQELCLLPIIADNSVDKVVVGVNQESHLDDLITSLRGTGNPPDLRHLSFCHEIDLIDPRRWSL